MRTKVLSALLVLLAALMLVAACSPAPTATPAPASQSASETSSATAVAPTATPAGIPPAVAPIVVAPALQPRTAKFRVLVVGCADGRCLEELGGTRTQLRYFRSIAGVPSQNFSAIITVEEEAMGGQFDLVVVGTHSPFCEGAGCGGQDLLDKVMRNPNFQVSPELQGTKDWVRSKITSADTLMQAFIDGDDVVRFTGGSKPVLVAVFDTTTQTYIPVRFYSAAQKAWTTSVDQGKWGLAQLSGWKQIPQIDTATLPESARAFLADNADQAPTLASIARARNFVQGQTFPEVVVTSSLRPVSERLGQGTVQGERFVVTLVEGMSPADVNAQVAYALAHAKENTNVRFLFERHWGQGVDWIPELEAANVNPAFLKWMRDPMMKGAATFEVWDEMTQIMKTTLRPAGVPVESFLMRGGSGAMMLLPGVFFEAAKLVSRYDVVGSQSQYAPNAAANALPEEFQLKESPVYRVHYGPDPTTMWAQFINRVPGGQNKACVKRALSDVSGALLMIIQDIPTMLSVCPNVWPPTSELKGAAIIYAVPGSSQEPITVAYRDGKWEQVSGTTLEYQLRVMNKGGIPFQAIFQMAIENGKEVHRFVRLVCGPPGFGDKLTPCSK